MFFVERALGRVEAAPERLLFPPSHGAGKLSFYFDFSSPWSYVGFMRLTSLAANVAPLQVGWAVLYCTVLYCAVLYCDVLYCTELYSAVLYCSMLYSTVLYSTVLYCTVLCCTVLCCTVI